MTIICALTDGERTWVGSDSRTSFGSLAYDISPKVKRVGDWLIAASGPTRAAYLTERSADRLVSGATIHSLADRLRRLLHKDGWKVREADGESGSISASWLVARPGMLWEVCCDFTVIPLPPGVLWATGSGDRLALGAGHALEGLGVEPEKIVRTGVEAAIRFDSGCGGEVRMEVLMPKVGKKHFPYTPKGMKAAAAAKPKPKPVKKGK